MAATQGADDYQKHPCNKFGACRFGAECRFAQYPVSACVFFLRGHCAIGLRCRYDHVREWDFFVNSEAAQRSKRRSSSFIAPGRLEAPTPTGVPRPPPPPPPPQPKPKPAPLHGPAARSHAIQGHGSYADYYHYRKDTRVDLLRPHEPLFLHQHVLDVGCNTGEFTLQFAQAFRCNSVLGVDIDPRLIVTAQKALGKYVNLPPAGYVPLSAMLSHGPLPPVPEALQPRVVCGVDFRHEDWLAPADPAGPYSVILCMSVTKWVHLSGGDAALDRLFRKAFTALAPGGLFVLEPQPWTSYKKKFQQYTEEQRRHFKEIQIRPTAFVEYLTATVGFVFVASIASAKAEAADEDSKKRSLEDANGSQPKRAKCDPSPAAPPSPTPPPAPTALAPAEPPATPSEPSNPPQVTAALPAPTPPADRANPPPPTPPAPGAPAGAPGPNRSARRGAAARPAAFQGAQFDRTIFLFRKPDTPTTTTTTTTATA